MKLLKKITKNRALYALLLAIPVCIATIWSSHTEFLGLQQLRTYDQFNQWVAHDTSAPDAVLVGFSESDMQRHKVYPFTDELLAAVLNKINQNGARTILLGILRDLPVEPGHHALLETYKNNNNIIGIGGYAGIGDTKMAFDAPPILKERGDFGYLNITGAVDLVPRVWVHSYQQDGQTQLSVFLRSVKHFFAAASPPIDVSIGPNGNLHANNRHYGVFSKTWKDYPNNAPMTALYTPISYKNITSYSFYDVLEKPEIAAALRDKLVIIGTTASSLSRPAKSPLDKSDNGTAPMLFTMITQSLIDLAADRWFSASDIPNWVAYLIYALLSWLCVWRMLSYRSLWAWLWRSTTLTLLIVVGCFGAYRLGYLLPVAPMVLIVALALIVVLNNIIRAERKQRGLIEVMHRVLDSLPDPVLLVDENQRIALVNRAFAQLAVARPDQLLHRRLSKLIDIDPDDEHHGTLHARSGEQLSLQLLWSVLQDEHNLQLRLARIQGVSRDQSQATGGNAFDLCFDSAAYWAREGGSLQLLLVELSEVDLLQQVHGATLLPAIDAACLARLAHAFPDAAALRSAAPFSYQMLSVRSGGVAEHISWIEQAFSWPLEVAGQRVEIDLRAVGMPYPGGDATLADMLAAAQAEFSSHRD